MKLETLNVAILAVTYALFLCEARSSKTEHDTLIVTINRDDRTQLRGLPLRHNRMVRRMNDNRWHSKKVEGEDIEGDEVEKTVEEFNKQNSEGKTHVSNRLNSPNSRQYLNPIAIDDEFTCLQNTAMKEKSPGLLINDEVIGGGTLTITDSSKPRNGNLTIMADGGFSYNPAKNFFGNDQFSYTIGNGNGGKDSAIVYLRIIPLARNHEFTILYNTRLIKTALDIVPNKTIRIRKYTKARNGIVTAASDGGFIYQPHVDFVGEDTFGYTAHDGRGASGTATISVVVKHPNAEPVATQDSFKTEEETTITVEAYDILVNDYDADGDTLSIESYSTPLHGTLIMNSDGGFKYTPNSGFVGMESFQYTINDGSKANNASSKSTIHIHIISKNEVPFAKGDNFSTTEGAAITVRAEEILKNDYDSNGDSLVILSYGSPKHGTVLQNEDGGFTYLPPDDFDGEDVFDYTVSDGKGGKHSNIITITVKDANKAPNAGADTFNTFMNVDLLILKEALLDNDSDPEGNFMTVVHHSDPIYGSITDVSDGLLYIPNLDFEGVDTFEYTVSDGEGGQSSAPVTIIIKDNKQVIYVNDSVNGTNTDEDAYTDEEDEGELSFAAIDAILSYIINILRGIFA